ncbi:DUF4377 domain-containing protein [Larkinella bovis]|uniref:DUF4377 domain-containing protein n=1 Tax=Larkinella bovis TaxID=683041 RepID=A0ABW0I7P6_9BACT
MKSSLRYGTLLLLLLFGACDKWQVKPDLITMQIADHQEDCMGVFQQRCLLVKIDEETNWGYFYSGIDGFTYEEGYEYRLIVRREPVKNPPQDASSIRYILVNIVEKRKI